MISLSLYWSLCVSQFYDNKRKDFWQMFIHHIAAIVLLSLSWVCNMFRIGSLVLVVHDCADIFLEVSLNFFKLLKLFIEIYRQLKWQSMLATKKCATQYLRYLH